MAKPSKSCYMCGRANTESFDEARMCNISDSEQVKQLSADPTASCLTCLASAHDPSYLCMPFEDRPQQR